MELGAESRSRVKREGRWEILSSPLYKFPRESRRYLSLSLSLPRITSESRDNVAYEVFSFSAAAFNYRLALFPRVT